MRRRASTISSSIPGRLSDRPDGEADLTNRADLTTLAWSGFGLWALASRQAVVHEIPHAEQAADNPAGHGRTPETAGIRVEQKRRADQEADTEEEQQQTSQEIGVRRPGFLCSIVWRDHPTLDHEPPLLVTQLIAPPLVAGEVEDQDDEHHPRNAEQRDEEQSLAHRSHRTLLESSWHLTMASGTGFTIRN